MQISLVTLIGVPSHQDTVISSESVRPLEYGSLYARDSPLTRGALAGHPFGGEHPGAGNRSVPKSQNLALAAL